ncbi:hypothetical protein C9439_03000 [archaeon SCG-AAA382B04]|nr:hypothetical protein C9439_03000 [archaeon SCG-AAA382B04]
MKDKVIPNSTYPKIIIGDAREELEKLPEGCIDTVVTSPPYWQQREYGDSNQIGQESSPKDYISNMLEVTKQLHHVLDDDGSFFLNIGDKYVEKDLQMVPSRLIYEMKEQGWALRNKIVWYKTNHMPTSIKDRFTNTWEPIFFLVKDDKNHYLAPRYNFFLDRVRIPHQTDKNSIPSPKDVLSDEELEELPNEFTDRETLPYKIEKEIYDQLPERLKTKGKTEYSGKFEGTSEINRGQSPGARMSVKGLYYSRQRKHDPNEEKVIKYLRKCRDNSKYSTSDIDDELGYSHTAGHWFRLDEGGRSLPSPEDWKRLKELLEFDDTFDKIMTETHYVLQGVRKHPKGKNPGDMWEISTASFNDAHFAVFPKELPRKAIKATCPKDGIVLDPFAGAGTTGKVAQELGRRSIMVELNEEYREIMKKRFREEENQKTLSEL